MSMTLSVIRAGTTYVIGDIGTGIRHIGEDGLGMPPLTRLRQRSPMQHGSTDIGFYLNDRKVNLLFALNAVSEAEYYAIRARLLAALGPDDSGISLRATFDSGAVRQLDAFLDGGLMFGSGERSYLADKAVATLDAPDPAWYDPTEQTLTWTISGATQLVFPATFPIQFISSVISSGQVVAYPGSWLSYPTIVITGPCQNPMIENLTTGEIIELVYNIAAGRVVTIALTPGAKSITDDLGTNLIGALNMDTSDLATFHLAPSPEVTDGDNTLFARLGGATPGTTSVQVKWFNKYVGI